MPKKAERDNVIFVRISNADRKLIDESVRRLNRIRHSNMGLTRWIAITSVLAAKVEHAINDGGDQKQVVEELVEFLTLLPRPEPG